MGGVFPTDDSVFFGGHGGAILCHLVGKEKETLGSSGMTFISLLDITLLDKTSSSNMRNTSLNKYRFLSRHQPMLAIHLWRHYSLPFLISAARDPSLLFPELPLFQQMS